MHPSEEPEYLELQEALSKWVAAKYPDESRVVVDWAVSVAHVGSQVGQTAFSHTYSNTPIHHLEGLVGMSLRNLTEEIDE